MMLFPAQSFAQNPNPYLGQPLPGSSPVIFAPGIVSKPPVGAYSITISRAGDEIYFSRYDGTKNTTWFTKRTDATWSIPAIASFGVQGYNTEAFFTPYSDTILFVSDKKDPNDTIPNRKRIWFVARTLTGWSDPQIFPIPLSTRDRYSPSIAGNGNMYFSEFGGISDWAIYKSELVNGVYQSPVKLGSSINGFILSAHCCIAPDERFILFDAQSSSGGHIYLSTKNPNGTWNTAIKLDAQINSTSNQYLAYLSPDRKYLFYASQENIYWCEWSTHNPVGVDEKSKEMPAVIRLQQNYPNPFNPTTNIVFSLTEKSDAVLSVYNTLGQKIEELAHGMFSAGEHSVQWNAARFNPGVYFYEVKTNSFRSVKKMNLLK